MGEPVLCPEHQTNVYGDVEYKLRILFGASVITSYRSLHAAIVRNSAGNYTITLPTNYNEITSFTWGFQDASGAILFAVIRSETIQTNGQMVVEIVTETGTATDPTSGDKLFLDIGVSKDTLNDKFTG